MKKDNFIFIPNKLISYDWLEQNGLNFKALFLWCHLCYYRSFHNDSWFSLKELYLELGLSKTRKQNDAWDDLLMSLTRFQFDGYVNFNGNLSEIEYNDHLTVKLENKFFSQKTDFILLEESKFKKLISIGCDIEKDVTLEVFLFVASHLLNGWCHYGKNKISEELHVRKTKVYESLDFLIKNDFLIAKDVINPQTGRLQTIYSPKK